MHFGKLKAWFRKYPGIVLTMILTAVIAASVAGVIGYCIGHDHSAVMQAEKDLDILLARSDLEEFAELEGTIYVTGHQSPDSDTICSSIAYAELLRKLGFDAQAVIQTIHNPINKNDLIN